MSLATDVMLRPHLDLLGSTTRAAFDGPGGSQRVVPAGARVIAQGTAPSAVELIRSGWAARYKSLRDGRRQIVSFLLPGDLIGIQSDITDGATATVEALTELQLQSGDLPGSHQATVLDLGKLAAVQKL
jgi:CRP-like cAMP-binding protein